MRPIGALVVALLIVPGPVSAAAVNGAWTTYMRAFTFADLAVRDGSVWCGTLEAGLMRFDPATGAYEEFVRRPGGLAGNAVAAVTFDRAGRLWAGTLGNGASVLDLEHDTWELVNAFDGLPSDSVRVIEADGDSLWIGTTRGLALWNGFEIAGALPDGIGPSPFASNRISGVATIGDTLWVATEEGIYRGLHSEGLATWTAVNGGLPASLEVDALASDGSALIAMANAAAWRYDRATGGWLAESGLGTVWKLSDDAGRIALSSSAGVYLWNGSGWDAVAPALKSTSARGRVFAVGIAGDGALYAANRDGVRVLATGATFFPPGAPGNGILNIEIQGPRVYVTTGGDGVGRLENGTWRYWPPGVTHSDTTFRDPLFVFAIVADTLGRKWFASWARINVADCAADTGTIEVLDDSVNPPQVTHIMIDDEFSDARHSFAIGSARDSSGGLWFGMSTPCADVPSLFAIGLDHYDAAGNFVANYDGLVHGREVHAITVDRDGRVWIGYKGQGIDTFVDPDAPDFIPITESSGLDVRGLEARGGSVWAFTTSDVRRYNLTRGVVQILPIAAGPSDLSVRPLDVGPDGRVWVGTTGGLRVYGPGSTFQDYTTSNSPMPDNEVRTVRVDPVSGVVWIATASGLARFDPGYSAGGSGAVSLAARVYPNPIRLTALGLGLRLATDAARVTGAVYGLDGRRVRSFSVSGSDTVIWDGRDGHGAPVHPGIFFVRVESGGRSAVARVAVLR